MAKKELTDKQKRCQDCANLIEKYGGVWACDECFGQLCEEIDDCPCGITIEDIKHNEEIEKTNTFKLVASAEDKPKRKPRERKADNDKRYLVKMFEKALSDNATNVSVTNIEREIEFTYNGRKFKLTLSAPRT